MMKLTMGPLGALPKALSSRLAVSLRTLRHLPRLFASLWRTNPYLCGAIVGLRLLCALQPPAVIYVGKLIIDEVILQTRHADAGLTLADWYGDGRLSTLLLYIALEFVLTFGVAVLMRMTTLAESILGELHGNNLAVEVLEHAAGMDLKTIESSGFQDKAQRAAAQTAMGSGLLAQMLGQAQNSVTVLALIAALVAYVPLLMILLLVSLLPSLFAEARFNAMRYGMSHRFTTERREADYMRYFGVDPRLAKEVRLFSLGGFFAQRFHALAGNIHRANRSLAVKRALWGSAFGAVSSLSYYLAYVLVTWQAVQGRISVGDLVFLAGSLLRLNSLFENLMLGFARLADQSFYLDDFYSFIDASPTISRPAAPVPFPAPLRHGITFENVGFRYPGRDGWTVRNLSFTLACGEVLALVGENGAGKTTIVKLMTRLYEPDEGRILVDGIDIREIALEDLRDHMGAIFQDFVRYNLTATVNIGVGRIEALGDGDRIRDAASRSYADQIVARLPHGYDQMLGVGFQRGHDLSGGEWQRIAIARAYFRNADILILDEPTAALDARAEAEVFERFRNLSQARTAMLISHRFSTVRMADRILVLENGNILESGSHDELMARKGRYAELFNLQAAGFQ